MESSFLIGQIAEYFGVSRDTLRHYDRLGILSPNKNQENSYRHYTRADFVVLNYIMDLREIGFSLQDIHELMNHGSVEKAEALMQLKKKEINDEMENLKHCLLLLEDYQLSFRNIIHRAVEPTITYSPSIIYLKLDDPNDSLLTSMGKFKDIYPDASPRFTFICPKEHFLADSFDQKITSPEARSTIVINSLSLVNDMRSHSPDALKLQGFHFVEPQMCLYQGIRVHKDHNYSNLVSIKDYIIKNKLEVLDDILIRLVSLRNGEGRDEDYYEIWVPLKK